MLLVQLTQHQIFRQNAAFPTLPKCHQYEVKHNSKCSRQCLTCLLRCVLKQPTSHCPTSFASQRSTLPPAYPSSENECAQPGTLQSIKCSSPSVMNVMPLITRLHLLFLPSPPFRLLVEEELHRNLNPWNVYFICISSLPLLQGVVSQWSLLVGSEHVAVIFHNSVQQVPLEWHLPAAP
jgi:hypothetical protein